VTYCQDCGAANDQANPTCRVCGRALQIQRSTLRCSACGEFVAIGAAFCSSCGASSDDVALGAPAEGGAPPSADAIEALIAATTAPAQAASTRVAPALAAPAEEPLDIGASLELPDWLKRAAAETPRDPTAIGAPGGGAGLDLASRAANLAASTARPVVVPAPGAGASGSGWVSSQEAPAAAEPPVIPSPGAGWVHDSGEAQVASAETALPTAPLPPIPDGGLATTMPAWLRPGGGPSAPAAPPTVAAPPIAAAPSFVAAPAAVAPPAPPIRSLADDPTDTASFISENDLPAWLRQLADTEAAQAEEARRAEEAARLAAEEARAAAEAEAAARPAAEEAALATSRARAADEGDDEPTTGTGPLAGRWLARHDEADDTGIRGRSAFEELVSEHNSEQEAIAAGAAPPVAASTSDRAFLAARVPSIESGPAPSSTGSDAKSWIVIGALVLIVVALLAYLYVNGSFG
jgi:hypothetical protein